VCLDPGPPAMTQTEGMEGTDGAEYAARMQRLEQRWWRRVLPVQLPYQLDLRRRRLGRTLDLGCGSGRNLGSLGPGSVGVDHNPDLVAMARAAGHHAFTVEEFAGLDSPRFDSMLLSHVLEHMDRATGVRLVRDHLPYVEPGGRVLFICPQERGYASDPTHVWFLDGPDLVDVAREAGLLPGEWRSFPLPRRAGTWFTYNELHLLSRRPAEGTVAGA
jgi:SAM-dependent methyltransferase